MLGWSRLGKGKSWELGEKTNCLLPILMLSLFLGVAVVLVQENPEAEHVQINFANYSLPTPISQQFRRSIVIKYKKALVLDAITHFSSILHTL
jgi:hypothetical protein